MFNELDKSVAHILESEGLLNINVINNLRDLNFDRYSLEKEFKKDRPILETFVGLHKYSLTWLVSQLFRQPDGRPLELLPFQSCLLDMLWSHKYPMTLASRGAGKTFIYALYAVLRGLLIPGQQIVIVGAGFRQAKLVFNYIQKLYQASPLFQEAAQAFGGPKQAVDQCHLSLGASNIYAIPLGDGEKIRGLRATCILCDEFGSIPEDIYEIVVQPFAAVHADPARRAKIVKLRKRFQEMNAPSHILDLITRALGFGNQICISGTASYEFNHFYRKYNMYRNIIFSNGDPEIIRRAFAEGNTYTSKELIDDNLLSSFKYTDYAVFQLPYMAIPEGFMDETVIVNAKLTQDKSRFGMEYLARFAKDSDGVFKRSLIDEATPRLERDGYEVNFELFGEKGAQYILGVDPARHNDNLAMVVIKLTQRGFEVVYCWAMNGKDWPTATEKVRELLARFNVVQIVMDQGGGGDAIADLLHDRRFIKEDEEPIWAIDDEENKFMPGKKILNKFQWSNQWIEEAVYSMHTEFRNRQLLIPWKVDESLALNQFATFYGKKLNSITQSEKEWVFNELYGEVNDDGDRKSLGVYENVQELINETCTIVKKVTEAGSETFILPPLSSQEKQGKLTDKRRRDRFSALLLAAFGARTVRGHGFEKKLLPGGTDAQIRRRSKQGYGGGIRRGSNGVVYPGY